MTVSPRYTGIYKDEQFPFGKRHSTINPDTMELDSFYEEEKGGFFGLLSRFINTISDHTKKHKMITKKVTKNIDKSLQLMYNLITKKVVRSK